MEKDFLVIYGINGINSNVTICSPINVEYHGNPNCSQKTHALMTAILRSHRINGVKPEIFSIDEIAIKSICQI